MTTKFPLCCVLMELSEQLQARSMALRLNWLPRETNTEADALTNEDFAKFDPSRRIKVEWGALPFRVLPDLLAKGKGFLEDTAQLRELQTAERGRPGKGVKRARVGLRTREPW